MCLRTITLVCNLDILYGLIAKDVALESYLYPHSLVVKRSLASVKTISRLLPHILEAAVVSPVTRNTLWMQEFVYTHISQYMYILDTDLQFGESGLKCSNS